MKVWQKVRALFIMKVNLLFSLTVLLALAEISRTFTTCGCNHLGSSSSNDIYKGITAHNFE